MRRWAYILLFCHLVIIWAFVSKVISLLFNTLSRLVIAFPPRSKRLLISWLQSLSSVILEPKKITLTLFPLFPHLLAMKWWDWRPWFLFFEYWVLSYFFHYPLSPSLVHKELEDPITCVRWGRTGTCPKKALLFLDCSSLYLRHLPSLISNCSHLPFGTQGRSRDCSLFPTNEKWGTQNLQCSGAQQGPAGFPSPSPHPSVCVFNLPLYHNSFDFIFRKFFFGFLPSKWC